MRISHQMDKVISKVRNSEPYRQSDGCFLINGEPIQRRTLVQAASYEYAKVVYCGTCGGLLCSENNPFPHEVVPAINTCAKCRQVQVYDSGYDDEPEMVQLYQDWRLCRVAIQRDPCKPPKARPAPPPPTPPLALEYSPLFDDLHPVNLNRSPVRRYPDGTLYVDPSKRKKDRRTVAEEQSKVLGRLSGSNVLQTELVGEKGWFTSKHAMSARDIKDPSRASTPSKAYIKWMNGFGYQEEYQNVARTLEMTNRYLLTSAGSDKRVRALVTGKIPNKTLGYIGTSFDDQRWSGFGPHEAASRRVPAALGPRKMRPGGGRVLEDKPHHVRSLRG